MKKTKTKRTRRQKQKTYSAYLLGIALITVLVGEYALITNATPADWKAGVSLLDVSDGVSQTVADIKFVFQPATDTVVAINNFYEQAAVAATPIFDFTSTYDGVSPMQFVYGVNDFYKSASTEMASFLDLTNYNIGSPRVAGASISR